MGIPLSTNKIPLLTLIQKACKRLAIPSPVIIFGNTDQTIIQLLELACEEALDFREAANGKGGWQELRVQHLFQTAGVGNITGNTTSGSPIITGMSSTTGIQGGYIAKGNGIPSETVVNSVDSATQVTLNTNVTTTSTGVSLAFGAQAYSLPNDINIFMTQTFWDRAFRWQLLGPLQAQEWQVLKSGISPTGPRRRFRIMGNYFYIDPVPSAVDTEVFEYYSSSYCQSASGTSQSTWLSDTDYYVLDDESFVLGLIWRFLSNKGLDYDEARAKYEIRKQRVIARNAGNRNLPTNATASGVRLLNQFNVPDTGFGS